MSADYYVTIKYRVNNLWDDSDPDASDENIKALIRGETIGGIAEDDYEILSLEVIK